MISTRSRFAKKSLLPLGLCRTIIVGNKLKSMVCSQNLVLVATLLLATSSFSGAFTTQKQHSWVGPMKTDSSFATRPVNLPWGTLVLASSEVKTDTGRPENRGRRDSRPARGPNNPNGQRGPRREGAGGGGSRTFNRGNSGGGNGGTVLKLTNPRKLVRVVEQEPLTEEERKEALDNFKERPASRGSDRPQRPVASAGEGGPAGASELNAPYDTGRYAQGGLGCEAVPFEVDDILPWLYCFVEFRCHDVGFFLPSSLGFVACEPSVAFDGIPSFHRVPVVLCDPLRGVV